MALKKLTSYLFKGNATGTNFSKMRVKAFRVLTSSLFSGCIIPCKVSLCECCRPIKMQPLHFPRIFLWASHMTHTKLCLNLAGKLLHYDGAKRGREEIHQICAKLFSILRAPFGGDQTLCQLIPVEIACPPNSNVGFCAWASHLAENPRSFNIQWEARKLDKRQ